jgi:hypothetical protein
VGLVLILTCMVVALAVALVFPTVLVAFALLGLCFASEVQRVRGGPA